MLVELEDMSDYCDVVFKKTAVELRAEAFMNRCRNERLNEQIVWLKKKSTSTATAAAGSERKQQHLIDRQTTVTNQIEELEKRLKIVVGTLVAEAYFQHESDKVGCVGSLERISMLYHFRQQTQ